LLSQTTLRFRCPTLESRFMGGWNAILYGWWDPLAASFTCLAGILFIYKGVQEVPWAQLVWHVKAGMIGAVLVRAVPLVAMALLPRNAYLRHRRCLMAVTRAVRVVPMLMFWPQPEVPCWVVRVIILEICVSVLGLLLCGPLCLWACVCARARVCVL
jgi:hypothetical protein